MREMRMRINMARSKARSNLIYTISVIWVVIGRRRRIMAALAVAVDRARRHRPMPMSVAMRIRMVVMPRYWVGI